MLPPLTNSLCFQRIADFVLTRTIWFTACHKGTRGLERAPITLRITVREDPEVIRLRLEGDLVGPYIDELERMWQCLAPSLERKKFLVDICDVLHIDAAGKQLLALIHSKSGAEFVADSVLTKYVAQEAMQSNYGDGKQGG